jgi:hypothetical protein
MFCWSCACVCDVDYSEVKYPDYISEDTRKYQSIGTQTEAERVDEQIQEEERKEAPDEGDPNQVTLADNTQQEGENEATQMPHAPIRKQRVSRFVPPKRTYTLIVFFQAPAKRGTKFHYAQCSNKSANHAFMQIEQASGIGMIPASFCPYANGA